MNILISLRSQEWIKKYLLAYDVRRTEVRPPPFIEFKTLVSWLTTDSIQPIAASKNNQKIEFIVASLHASFLQDLGDSLKGDNEIINKKYSNSSIIKKLRFFLLTVAGLLVAACQGFDGIVTVLSVFALAPLIILGLGLAFVLLSVIAFLGTDLVKVSNALGIHLSKYKLLEAHLSQLQYIKSIRKKINNYVLAGMSQSELNHFEEMLSMLQTRFMLLITASKQFDEALNSKNMRRIKNLISGVSTLFFFGSGFFTGQSVALFLAGFFLNPIAPTFYPIMIFSVIIGLAAASVYWYVERPELEKLISSWFGLNEECVEKLCNESLLDKEANKLACLKEKVSNTVRFTQQFRSAQLQNKTSANEESPLELTYNDVEVSSNCYSFLKSSVLSRKAPNEHREVHKAAFYGGLNI